MLDGDKIDQKHIYTCVCVYIYICISLLYALYILYMYYIHICIVYIICISYIYVFGQFYLHQSFIYIYNCLIVMKSVLITQQVSTENIICANKNCMTLSLIHINILLKIIVPMIIMIHSNKSMNLQIQLAYFLVDSV